MQESRRSRIVEERVDLVVVMKHGEVEQTMQ
jgi:hypothetical protein